MYLIRNNSVVPLKLKDIVFTEDGRDNDIALLEKIVADNYNVKVADLDVFYKDSDAKLMCCFLVHDLLKYTIKSIAVKYGVNVWYLHSKIQEYYLQCLRDDVFMNHVSSLRDAFNVRRVIN